MSFRHYCFSSMLLSLSFLSLHAHAVIVVQNNNDSGPGSLRRAINEANIALFTETIRFNIPGAGPHNIQLFSQLPAITQPVRIIGYTEPGSSPANNNSEARIRIMLDGSAAGVARGLEISADNVRISGLAIRNFHLEGIKIFGSNNIIRGNYIGTSVQGLFERPNGNAGIKILGDANQIGGNRPAHRNLISANEAEGVAVNGNHNMIQGNFIGTDISTTEDFGNGEEGILINGENNLVGGTEKGVGNVISGNSIGVHLRTGGFNQVQGNIIGTDKSATVDVLSLGNGTGVRINGIRHSPGQNEIGGEVPEARNIISNNIGIGVDVLGDENTIRGNFIGTDGSGSFPLGNSTGISIRGDRNLVGGANKNSRNIISGNNGVGIVVQGFPTIGGNPPQTLFTNKPDENNIQANFIGTDVSGEVHVSNGAHGILVKDADTTTIGGNQRSQGNLISGNDSHGIVLEKFNIDFGGTLDTFVFNNTIGTDVDRIDSIENSGSGVFIKGASQTRIGGVHRGRENYIANNGGDGITVESGVDNGFIRNWIHSNAGLAIDLNADGVTDNDLLDADAGANRSQNFMEINKLGRNGASAYITASLPGSLSGHFRVDFYATETCDSSGHGEGQIFLGARRVDTSTSATRIFSLASSVPVPDGYSITGIVSVLGGPFPADTSEFAECVVL